MKRTLIKLLRATLDGLLLLPVAAALALAWVLRSRRSPQDRPRLLWQSTPIKSLAYMARAMREAGYESDTAVVDLYRINRREDFDHVLVPQAGGIIGAWRRRLMAYGFFFKALRNYDVFFCYFDGGVLRQTPLARWEFALLKAFGKKLVLLPYGSDAFVYDTLGVPVWRHGLMMSYPGLGNRAQEIQQRLRRSVVHADVVLGCLAHFANLPRWDMLPLTCYPVDTQAIQPAAWPTTQGPIRIAHAANHRGVKGTEFLLRAVRDLVAEGHPIELDLIEGVSNEEALARIARADLYVDQLVMGYALAAQEAMALGRVVLSPVDGTPETDLFRTYSYLDECPIVSANQRNIKSVLLELIGRRADWARLGQASRRFVEKRHSYAASAAMYEAVLDRVWRGKDVDLINYFHPILESRHD